MAFFEGIFLNCAKSDHRFLLTFLFAFGDTALIEFIQYGGHRAQLGQNDHLFLYTTQFS